MTMPAQTRLAKQAGGTISSVSIVQGEQHVSGDHDMFITTILGSCVAACIRDPYAGVGGMNHFLLPEQPAGLPSASAESYGAFAMELLLNRLFQAGARRNRLEAKLFGGACVVQGLSDVGARNAEFACNFLRDEGIVLVSSSLGGESARRVQYWPVSGRARQSVTAQAPEPRIVAASPRCSDVELF